MGKKWNVVLIDEATAIQFLKENKANKETILIRHCDEWMAIYDNNILCSVTGIKFSKGHMGTDCSYTLPQYRNQGMFSAFYEYVMERFPDKDFVCYCSSPYTAKVLIEKYGFKKVREFSNGTVHVTLKRSK